MNRTDLLVVPCKNCKYYQSGVCCNYDSEWCAEFQTEDCSCKDGELADIFAETTLGKIDYENGYNQAMIDINTPKKVIQENWCPSKCPTCHKDFSEYEDCDDGYYSRVTSMERCPYCGQNLKW